MKRIWIVNNGQGYFAYRNVFAYRAGEEPVVRAKVWESFVWALREQNWR